MGHDVLTTREAGKAGYSIPDEEVLAFALREGRVVLTNNTKHFLRLHRRQDPHAGIVTYNAKPDTTTIAQQIDAALSYEFANGRFLARTNSNGFHFDP